MQTVCVFCRNVASQRAPGLKERERERGRERVVRGNWCRKLTIYIRYITNCPDIGQVHDLFPPPFILACGFVACESCK